MDISAEGLLFDFIVGLAGGMIFPLIRLMAGFCANMFIEVRVIEAIAEVVVWKPVSCVMDVYPTVIIDALPATVIDVVGSDIGGVNLNMWAVTATTFEFILILASASLLAEILRLGWEKCDC